MAANLKDVLEAATHAPGGVKGLGSAVESVSRAGTRLVVLEGGAELGAGSVGVVAAIGEILADFALWGICLAIVGIVISMKETEWVFMKVASYIPLGGDRHAKDFIQAIFRPIDQLEGWVADRMGQIAVNISVNFIQAIRKFMEYQFGVTLLPLGGSSGTQAGVPGTGSAPIPGTGGLATSSQIDRVQREINDIYRRINAEDRRISNIEDHTGAVLVPDPGVQPLKQRVQRLENLVGPLTHDTNVLHGRVVKIEHNLTVIHDELQGLQRNLGAVRAVQFGVQDVLDMVLRQTAQVQYQVNQLEPQVDAHTRTLHVLYPLQSLLYLGAVGIQNLQKLEKNPCQCPGVPGFPGDDADYMTLYGFISNG